MTLIRRPASLALIQAALALICALALPLGAFAQLHVAPLPAKSDDASNFVFPFVTGGSEQADQRINTWLQVSQLQKLPGRYKKSPFEDIEPQGDSAAGTQSLDYKVSANTRSYFSLVVSGEYDSASVNLFSIEYDFEAHSGNPLTLPDLFSAEGLARFTQRVHAAHMREVNRYLASLGPATANPQTDDDENKNNARRIFSDCRSALANEKLRGNDFSLGKDTLSISLECAQSHYDQATTDEEFGPIVTTYRFQALAVMLSDYGRCLLIDQRADCVNPHLDPSRGILHGTLDGRYPITLVYGTQGNDGYFYDKFGKFIELSGGLEADGTVRLRESREHGPDAMFVLKRREDGTVTGTWTQKDTGRTLAVELHP